jgi:hypothetical protein
MSGTLPALDGPEVLAGEGLAAPLGLGTSLPMIVNVCCTSCFILPSGGFRCRSAPGRLSGVSHSIVLRNPTTTDVLRERRLRHATVDAAIAASAAVRLACCGARRPGPADAALADTVGAATSSLRDRQHGHADR